MLLWKAPSLSGANVESEIKGGLKNMYCTTRSILIAMDALSLGRHGGSRDEDQQERASSR